MIRLSFIVVLHKRGGILTYFIVYPAVCQISLDIKRKVEKHEKE